MALRTWSWARVAMAGRRVGPREDWRVGAREDWRDRTICLVPGAAQCQLPERGEGKLPGSLAPASGGGASSQPGASRAGAGLMMEIS